MRPRHGRLVQMVCVISMLATAWGAVIDIPVCTTPPKLDADLDDGCRQQVTKRTGFHTVLTSSIVQTEGQPEGWTLSSDGCGRVWEACC